MTEDNEHAEPLVEPDEGAIGPDGEQGHSTRGRVFLAGLKSTATVCLQMIVVLAFLYALMILLAKFWVVLLPVILAIVVSTVLWPPVRWLRSKGVPAAGATVLVVLIGVGVVAGVIGLIVPSIVDQAPELANQAVDGVKRVQDWAQGPPLNIGDEQISSVVTEITDKLQKSASTIATGVFNGVGVATSAIVTLFTTAVLVFFFLKDGPRFIPWLNRTMGVADGQSHLGEVMLRMWNTLGGFIRTQAIVSFVDAALIGIGLVVLNVPLAGVLIVITFIGGFIPIVGAFVAGALAVLIALVSGSVTKALIVLAIILVVQQLEGNVLQPWLQAKSMDLHAVIVLLAVTLGGSLYGITGAFLAVPAASCLAVALRYILEQIGKAAGEQIAEEDAEAAAKAAKGQID